MVSHPVKGRRQGPEHHRRGAGLTPRFRFKASSGMVVCQTAAPGPGAALPGPFVAGSTPAPQLVMRLFAASIALP